MKKILFLVMALTMILSMAACSDEKSIPETTAPAVIELNPSKTVTTDSFTFAVLGGDVTALSANGITDESMGEDDGESDVHVRVFWGFKNVGARECMVDDIVKINSVTYNDNYIFEHSEDMQFNGAGYGKVYPKTLEPLSDATIYMNYFTVPREVLDNTEANIDVNLTIEGQEYVYHVRPINVIEEKDPFAEELIEKLEEGYMIRNAGYYTKLAWNTAAFVWKYGENTNKQGERKWSEDFLSQMEHQYDDLYLKYSKEEIAEKLPETAVALDKIEESFATLKKLLIEVGEQNSAELAKQASAAGMDICVQISDLLNSDELLQFGKYEVHGKLSDI